MDNPIHCPTIKHVLLCCKLGSSHYLLLKHLGNTLKSFRRCYVANTIQCNTITFINVPTVTGHFGMMCYTYTTIIPSNELKC